MPNLACNFRKSHQSRLCTFITSKFNAKKPQARWKTPPPSPYGVNPIPHGPNIFGEHGEGGFYPLPVTFDFVNLFGPSLPQ